MLRKKNRKDAHVVEFEEGGRKARVIFELNTQKNSVVSLIIGIPLLLLKIIFFPIILPLKLIWFLFRNTIND